VTGWQPHRRFKRRVLGAARTIALVSPGEIEQE
jgi:hypothetical protein